MPKERHVLKEGIDSSLGLCLGPKESHGCPGLEVTASTTTRLTTRRSVDQMGDQITPGDQINDQIPTATKM